MSFVLTCPNCGTREVTDFAFGGEASVRPGATVPLRELGAYNYFRRNVAGVQREWWSHRSGCKAWFLAERDTRTNEVAWTALPKDAPAVAPAPGAGGGAAGDPSAPGVAGDAGTAGSAGA